MSRQAPDRCPLCRARHQDLAACPRCGADLMPLRRIAIRARWLRDQARKALAENDLARAHDYAQEAQWAQWTRVGQDLELLTRWLESPW